MNEINRHIFFEIQRNLDKQKVSLILGARRVGKTKLIEKIRKKNEEDVLWLFGEDEETKDVLEERSISNYKRLIGKKKILIIDKAQHIPEIALKTKLMIDTIQPLHIILTGSSAFHLHQMGHPLIGRTLSYHLFPIAQIELQNKENLIETKQNLETRLIFGSYPELFLLKSDDERKIYLKELIEFNLLKDILAFEEIRNPQKLKSLLVLLAYQVGQEVSLEELGRQLGMSKNTVEKYMDMLEKIFIIFKRRGFSRNLRKEVTKNHKWYFYDNGIRNAFINDFTMLSIRTDVGMLWENYMVSERVKFNSYQRNYVNSYFWRTYDGQEIDLIEEGNGKIEAFEFKWSNQKTKKPVAFDRAYPNTNFNVIHKENYLNWITN